MCHRHAAILGHVFRHLVFLYVISDVVQPSLLAPPTLPLFPCSCMFNIFLVESSISCLSTRSCHRNRLFLRQVVVGSMLTSLQMSPFLVLPQGSRPSQHSHLSGDVSVFYLHRVTKVRETGLLMKWKQFYWPRQNFCARGTMTVGKAVNLDDIQGAYYALSVLTILSCLALLAEFACGCPTIRKARHLVEQKQQLKEARDSYT